MTYTFDVVLCRHVLWALPRPAAVLQCWANLLAPGGRLEAIKRGRNWYTTAAAIRRYRDSLNRRPIQPMEGHE